MFQTRNSPCKVTKQGERALCEQQPAVKRGWCVRCPEPAVDTQGLPYCEGDRHVHHRQASVGQSCESELCTKYPSGIKDG